MVYIYPKLNPPDEIILLEEVVAMVWLLHSIFSVSPPLDQHLLAGLLLINLSNLRYCYQTWISYIYYKNIIIWDLKYKNIRIIDRKNNIIKYYVLFCYLLYGCLIIVKKLLNK